MLPHGVSSSLSFAPGTRASAIGNFFAACVQLPVSLSPLPASMVQRAAFESFSS
jgi:hypothetical protein